MFVWDLANARVTADWQSSSDLPSNPRAVRASKDLVTDRGVRAYPPPPGYRYCSLAALLGGGGGITIGLRVYKMGHWAWNTGIALPKILRQITREWENEGYKICFDMIF